MKDDLESAWHVYILECADGSFYIGCTNRLAERVQTHNLGKGAKYTAGRLPVTLEYAEMVSNRSEALKRERQLKKWPRSKKMALIRAGGSKKARDPQ